MTPNDIGAQFDRLMLVEAKRILLAGECDTRRWNDCFENGRADILKQGLVVAVVSDPAIADAVRRNAYYCPKWLRAAASIVDAAQIAATQ